MKYSKEAISRILDAARRAERGKSRSEGFVADYWENGKAIESGYQQTGARIQDAGSGQYFNSVGSVLGNFTTSSASPTEFYAFVINPTSTRIRMRYARVFCSGDYRWQARIYRRTSYTTTPTDVSGTVLFKTNSSWEAITPVIGSSSIYSVLFDFQKDLYLYTDRDVYALGLRCFDASISLFSVDASNSVSTYSRSVLRPNITGECPDTFQAAYSSDAQLSTPHISLFSEKGSSLLSG